MNTYLEYLVSSAVLHFGDYKVNHTSVEREEKSAAAVITSQSFKILSRSSKNHYAVFWHLINLQSGPAHFSSSQQYL